MPPASALALEPKRSRDESPFVTAKGPTITVIIPAYNESAGLPAVLRALVERRPGNMSEIIVVDDCSTDDTADQAEAFGEVRVIRQPRNMGYGASLKTGIREAKSEYILTMDADGQHRMEDVELLCRMLEGDEAPECIIGQRTRLLHSPLWRMPGKWAITSMAEFLIQQRIPDLNSGLRVLRRDTALRYIRLCPQGFSFSTTLTMALLSRGHRVVFEPIRVEPRQGKSTVKIRTGFQTILLVLRLATLFNPLRIFLPLSLVFWVVGIGWAIPYAIAGEGITVAAMLAMLTGMIMFALGLITDQVAQLRLERFE